METVNKGPEPQAWTNHRQTPGADYEATSELKFSLLTQQGFTCAYCGRRIPCIDRQFHGDKDPRADRMRIEHVIPRETLKTAEKRMVYENLVACCPGAIGYIPSKKGFASHHCDLRKGSSEIHFDIFDKNLPAHFKYVTNSKSQNAGAVIHVNSPGLQVEIGNTDRDSLESDSNVLNLNHPILRTNRMAIIKAIEQKAIAESKRHSLNAAWWEKLLSHFESMSENVKYINPETGNEERFPAYPAYRAIACFYIRKKLRACGAS